MFIVKTTYIVLYVLGMVDLLKANDRSSYLRGSMRDLYALARTATFYQRFLIVLLIILIAMVVFPFMGLVSTASEIIWINIKIKYRILALRVAFLEWQYRRRQKASPPSPPWEYTDSTDINDFK